MPDRVRGASRGLTDTIRTVPTWSIAGGPAAMSAQPLKILVYSHRPEIREAIITAVGRRPAPDIGRGDYVETGPISDVLMVMDAGEIDLGLLDGRPRPAR